MLEAGPFSPLRGRRSGPRRFPWLGGRLPGEGQRVVAARASPVRTDPHAWVQTRVETRGYEALPGGQSSDFDLKVNGERLKINNVNEKGQSK